MLVRGIVTINKYYRIRTVTRVERPTTDTVPYFVRQWLRTIFSSDLPQ